MVPYMTWSQVHILAYGYLIIWVAYVLPYMILVVTNPNITL